MKENKAFDKNIRDKLSEVHPDEHSDWGVFSKLLEQSEIEETYSHESIDDDNLDQSIQQKLQNHAVPYQPSHWEELKKSLEAEAYIKRRLLIAKATELSILFLVLFTYQTIFDPIGTWLREPILMADNLIESNDHELSSTDHTSHNIISATEMTVSKKESEHSVHGFIARPIRSRTSNHKLENSSAENSPSNLAALKDHLLDYHKSSNSVVSTHVTTSKSDKSTDKIGYDLDTQIHSLVSLPTLEPSVISFTSTPLYYDGPAVFRFSNPDREARHNGTYLSAFAGIDNNIIDTPQDPIFANILDHTSYATGYSTGIGILDRKGRWDLGLGLYYSTQAYNPRGVTEVNRPNEVNPFKATTLDFIRYDLIGLNTSTQYRLAQGNHWSLFAQAGVGLHMIMASNYTFTEKIADKSFRTFEVAGRADLDSSLKLAKKSYEEGLIEGGSVFDNSYMVANIGIGIERYLTHNISIFGSAGYRHHLFTAAVGPNEDKIHSLSGQIGVRMGI